MINVAICDDDSHFCENMMSFLKKNYPDIIKNIDDFANGEEFLNHIEHSNMVYNFIFLDIDMPQMDGLNTGNALRSLPTHIHSTIIFITAFDSPITNVIDIHPFAYIKKPIDFYMLKKKFDIALDRWRDDEKFVILTAKKNTYKLTAKDILYIEASMRKSIIHCSNGSTITVNLKLSDILGMISDKHTQFTQIHKSFIINLLHICQVTNSYVFLDKNISLPISKLYKNDFLTKFAERFLN